MARFRNVSGVDRHIEFGVYPASIRRDVKAGEEFDVSDEYVENFIHQTSNWERVDLPAPKEND